jgi:hypothetical protein
VRKTQRQLRCGAEWDANQNRRIQAGRTLPQILDLIEETQDHRVLQVALPRPEALCSICQGGMDMPAERERDANLGLCRVDMLCIESALDRRS